MELQRGGGGRGRGREGGKDGRKEGEGGMEGGRGEDLFEHRTLTEGFHHIHKYSEFVIGEQVRKRAHDAMWDAFWPVPSV